MSEMKVSLGRRGIDINVLRTPPERDTEPPEAKSPTRVTCPCGWTTGLEEIGICGECDAQWCDACGPANMGLAALMGEMRACQRCVGSAAYREIKRLNTELSRTQRILAGGK
jgi:hypothetical protein